MSRLSVATVLPFAACGLPAVPLERQITHAPYGHVLTNINVWSPDSRWIIYDVRSADTVFSGTRIEQVEVATGKTEVIYESKNGAACGVVTYHPHDWKVVFILGPERPTAEWSYGTTRRRGVTVDVRPRGAAKPLDAMNYAPPFTPGALRGGSHVHVFSPDGGWVSNTYEDEVLARLGPASGDEGDRDFNQRNIAVSVPAPRADGVGVARGHPRSHDGEFFSVVVTRTVNHPRPGSDEINRAYEEGWLVGGDGRRRLAFLGNVIARDGREHAEVFIADLPKDLTTAGGNPLEGTLTRRPAPPAGVVQRRLTFTEERRFRGAATTPRHWVRASPDGGQIAFLMKDDSGVVQLWTIASAGGAPRQVTREKTGITSAFTWSPDGRWVAHMRDNQVFLAELATGRAVALTPRSTDAAAPLSLACVFSPDGRSLAFMRNVRGEEGSFPQIFVVAVPLL